MDKWCLNLSQAAVDEQLDTVHIAAVIRGQKQDGFRDLIGSAGAAQGYAADGALHKLVDLLLRHSQRSVVARSWHDPGANRVHSYLAVFQVHTPGASK